MTFSISTTYLITNIYKIQLNLEYLYKKVYIHITTDYPFAINIIRRDKKSDKQYREVGNNTLVVTDKTVDLLKDNCIELDTSDYIMGDAGT
jgi:hypothetical protein